ncbi:MAG TPA: HNH endonuclease [Anaerolineales bacterium]
MVLHAEKGIIHVHHLIPLSEIKGTYDLDPIKDLVPVCPNCHAIIHSTQPPLTIEQLKEHLSKVHK